MNPRDERKIRLNWSQLKQTLNVDDFVREFLALGVISEAHRKHIVDEPNEKGDRFLEAVISGGNKLYQTMCNILLEQSNNSANQTVIGILELEHSQTSGNSNCERQPTAMSIASTNSSMSLNLGDRASPDNAYPENRMFSARAPWRAELTRQETVESVCETEESPRDDLRPTTPAEAVQRAVKMASDTKSGTVNMETLEQELVKIAPTIADLFSKIHQQTNTTVVATSDEELQKIKNDNDRLRKTNRTLVEKLNSFQQKIIQLQLENKKLREGSENEKIKQNVLEQKSEELSMLKDKLVEQKKALEEKEKELDFQMEKIAQVVTDNEEQKLMLLNLENLHEDGMKEYEDQQQQIVELQQEKNQQKEQIQVLEEKQKMSENMLYRLEERLLQLERGGPGPGVGFGAGAVAAPRSRNPRAKFGLSKPWMNGAMERSHHVNVKLQPQFPTDWSSNPKGGKGWSF